MASYQVYICILFKIDITRELTAAICQHCAGDEYKKEAVPRAPAFFGNSHVSNMDYLNRPAEDALTSQARSGK